MDITDLMVETALTAEHENVGRHYVDKPFWYSDLDQSERIRAHDGMRAALEAVAEEIASIGWERSKKDHEAFEDHHPWGEWPPEPTNPYTPKHMWKEGS